VTGLLVETDGDPGPLTAAIERLLCEPELARAMGERGRERALRDFTWESRAAAFSECLGART
jgi:starch synthase